MIGRFIDNASPASNGSIRIELDALKYVLFRGF